ncbi:hypothetical protein Lfee_0912, partial [Legionella feeleii]
MHTNAAKGTEVHSGEQFGIRGYWVNKDPDNPDVVYIEDIEDEVPEHKGSYCQFWCMSKISSSGLPVRLFNNLHSVFK